MLETIIQKYHLHKNEPDKLQFEIYSLKDYLDESGDHAQEPHIHSFYQIIWFMSGEGKHSVDFNEYQVITNTIFFISKGQVHHFDNSKYDGYIIHFNESFIADNENYINIYLKYNIFDAFEKEPLFRIKEADSLELKNIAEQMQYEIQKPNEFAQKEYLKLLLHLFLIIIQRFGVRKDCDGLSMNNPVHILFVKFRHLLEKHYYKIHTVSEYARLLNVSNKTLTNCTNGISHQTPLEIITERILLEARRLLAYSDKNINEIGFELGFEDPSYFVKFFKRNMKILPGDYRRSAF